MLPTVRVGAARLGVLDWIAIGLFAAGVLFVAAGLLPSDAAETTLRRIAPLVLFLFAVIIMAELTEDANFFDVVAARVAIGAGGSYAGLFGLSVAFATVTTVFLNLDTTAVLLTPVLLATAIRAGIATMPLAMTTVWLANTASLLLPVSNLTNLLAADRVGLPVLRFAERMALPQIAAVATTAACLWLFYWRRGLRADDRYTPPPPYVPRDRVLFRVAALNCVGFVVAVLAGASLPVVSAACAVVLLVAYAIRARDRLTWNLVPWRLVVFLSGLFLVVGTVSEHGLGISSADGHRRLRRCRRGVAGGGDRRRPVEPDQQPSRVRGGGGGHPARQPRPAARPAHRHERRADRAAVGVARHDPVAGAVPCRRRGRGVAAFPVDQRGDGGRGAGGVRRGSVVVVRQAVLDERRRRILAAALKVFAERGYHNAGIADIAQEVGAGHGTFYRYFTNKRDILDHVLAYAGERITAVLAGSDPDGANTLAEYRAQVGRIGDALFTLFVDEHQIVPVFFMQSMSVDAEMTGRVLAVHDAMAGLTEAYLRNGVRKGFLRADLDTAVTARAVNGMITAGAVAALRFDDPAAERDRWVRGVTTLMLDGCAGPH